MRPRASSVMAPSRCAPARTECRSRAEPPRWSSSKWRTMARAFLRKCKSDCSTRFSAPRRKAPVWVYRSRSGLSTSMAGRWNLNPFLAKARPSALCCRFIAMEDEVVAKILIIDDDRSVPKALQAALAKAGHEVEIATDAEEGLALAAMQDFEVVVADLHWKVTGTTRQEPKGLHLIAQLRGAKPQLPVILMTAHPATDTTIDATQRGAYDYLTKPGTHQEMQELVNTVRKAADSLQLVKPAPMGEATSAQHEIRGKSRAIQTVFKEIGRVAARPVTVLIRGETGTGKEQVARALHAHSDRKREPFIIVNCAAIPESLLESELFGHEQGAFTGATAQRVGRFEQADRGTIFLDEIGDMSVSTQAKLLRVLQERTIQRVGGKEGFQVDVRVISATHRNLESAVEEKTFRQDLYYRLNDAVIRLPQLRERKEDIPELANFFVQRHAAELGAVGSTIDPEAMQHLQRQPWPGNVREL